MASAVDICNLALGFLGDEANVQTIDPPDGTAQARHCSQFYPMARDATLELHAWGFATTRARLERYTFNNDTKEWAYAFALPANYLKALRVEDDSATMFDPNAEPIPYMIEGIYLYCNIEAVRLVYLQRITDPTKFTPLFVTTLSYMLASMLAGPIIKGTAGMQVSEKMAALANRQLAQAEASDANASQRRLNHVASWTTARNGY